MPELLADRKGLTRSQCAEVWERMATLVDSWGYHLLGERFRDNASNCRLLARIQDEKGPG